MDHEPMPFRDRVATAPELQTRATLARTSHSRTSHSRVTHGPHPA